MRCVLRMLERLVGWALPAGVGALLAVGGAAWGADRPSWGEGGSRNMVSAEKGLAETFDPAGGLNVKWSAKLGTQTWSTPVVAGGRVLIGTNNDRPRDPQHKGDCGVLMCFSEKDGAFQWQLVVPKRGPSMFLDWPHTGLVSACAAEGDRVYLVTNRDEIMCLDLDGMADGNDGPYRDEGRHMVAEKGGERLASDGGGDVKAAADSFVVNGTDADIIWVVDLPRELGVHPHDAAHCSVLVDGPYVYACTSNGVDDTHKGFPRPDAPSLVVVEKDTGRVVARDDEHMGRRTIHCTWSSPAIGEVNGRRLVFFGGGDGVCYAFEALRGDRGGGAGDSCDTQPEGNRDPILERMGHPEEKGHTLKRVWRFDCDPAAPREDVLAFQDNLEEGPSNIIGMPVFDGNRVYVAAGGDVWHGKPLAWLKCIDAAGTGDITKSGEVWSYPLARHCMSTPAVWNGLVFIGDCGRRIHCIDARTGQACWTHEARGEIWASPLVADGKVYVAATSGELWVLAAEREKRVIGSVRLGEALNGTPVAANGTLYVTAMTKLYAVGPKQQEASR